MHRQRRKSHVDSTLLPTRLLMIRIRKGTNREGPGYSTFLRLSFYAEDYWKQHPITPIQLSLIRPPTFTGRHAHLEDVATMTRQKRKTFSNRLTCPQLGAQNPKLWRSSIASPKARHLKPLYLHFRLNRSRSRMPRGNEKSCSSA